MPHAFGSGPSHAGLATWIGWYLRAGADSIGREVNGIARRAKTSSGNERSAWLYRGIVSCALVAGEILVLYWLSLRPDSVATLVTSWCVLLVLPKPTPRIPLFAARWIALIALLLNLNVLFDVIKSAVPGAKGWDGAFTMLWWVCTAMLAIWAFRALWPRSHRFARSTGIAPVHTAGSIWSNVPTARFADLGGLDRAKREVEIVARNRFPKKGSGIVRNGVLLYGPQGTGKNFLAEATAGEFRVNFHHVRCPELMGVNIGSTSAEIRRLFEWAAAHRPIVLFLDEIDSIGSRKQPQGAGTDAGGGGREYNTVTTQLMQSIDRYRSLDGLLIIAASNYLDGLEPTLIREGRFDLKLRLDLPDEEGRKEILAAQLARQDWWKHDLSDLARRTPGWSPARLKGLVDRAALLADGTPIAERHLIEALESSGGQDRPALENVTWDDVVLPQRVIEDLQALIRLMEPGAAERLSLPPPTGLILLGALGVGKTMTAKLVACQARRSFFAITPSDVLSGAVGGSVRRMSEIFARAKENAPSILFFDEMDGLFPTVRGPVGQHDVQLVEQALIEISALKPEHNVFLVGTTNYLDRVDPRILRGGRFSEKIEIGAPDEAGYRRLLARYLGKAQLAGDLSLDIIIRRVQGMSPADLEAMVNTMKRLAMRRMPSGGSQLPPLDVGDLEEALGRVLPQS
jgi:transitional endoplasmic reticulum ATPase